MAEKKQREDHVKELLEKAEEGVRGVFESAQYKRYLSVMSRFHSYSARNCMLILLQNPDATYVAGYDAWKRKFHRQVQRNEKGLAIIGYTPYKRTEERTKTDANGRIQYDADGNPIVEEVTRQYPMFSRMYVYDVSQTKGEPLPKLVNELEGDVHAYHDLTRAITEISPLPITFQKVEGGAKGCCNFTERKILVQPDMSERQTVKTMLHEVTHAFMHDPAILAESEESKDRRRHETEAESVAYVVCEHYGIDTSDYSFPYLAGWSSGQELKELNASLDRIQKRAEEMISQIDDRLRELQKERNKEQSVEREEQKANNERPEQNAEPTVTVLFSESDQLHENETMSLTHADRLFRELDSTGRAGYYDKTSFRIDFVMNGKEEHYEGRQDIGDGVGGLIDHIEKYHTSLLDNAAWEEHLLEKGGAEAVNADKAHREMLLNEFVPYLRLHESVSEIERAAHSQMQQAVALLPAEAAYYAAIDQYASNCRSMLNQGCYELPTVPKLTDFDENLRNCKRKVEPEAAPEAAPANVTATNYSVGSFQTDAAPEQERNEPAFTAPIVVDEEDGLIAHDFKEYASLMDVPLWVEMPSETNILVTGLVNDGKITPWEAFEVGRCARPGLEGRWEQLQNPNYKFDANGREGYLFPDAGNMERLIRERFPDRFSRSGVEESLIKGAQRRSEPSGAKRVSMRERFANAQKEAEKRAIAASMPAAPVEEKKRG